MAINDDLKTQLSLTNALKKSLESLHDEMKRGVSDQKAMEAGFEDAADVLRDKFTNELEKSLERIKTIPKPLVAASGALKGFGVSFKLIGGVVKFGIGAFQALASSVLGVVDSIADFSIGLFKDAMQEANDNIMAVINATASLTGQFGDLGHGSGELAKNMAKGASNIRGARYQDQLNLVGQAAAGTGAAFRMLGRDMGPKAQKRFGKTFTALALGAGISGEAMDGLASVAIATGGDLAKMAKQTAGDIGYMAKKIGISSKELGKDFSFLMTNMDTFGVLSAETAVQTSAYFRNLGVEASKAAGVMKKFNTFKDAAESVGLLNQAFGVQLDAYAMMNEQDPAKQFEMLRRSVYQSGQSFSSMSRQQQQYMAQLTGMDVATAAVAFSQENQGKSLDDIKKSMKDATPQERMAKGMKQLNKAIAPVTAYIKMFTDFFAAMYEGVKRALAFMIPSTSRFFGSLQGSFQKTQHGAERMTAVIVNKFPGVKAIIEGFIKLFEPGNTGRLFKAFNTNIGKYLGGGAKDFKGFFTQMKIAFTGIFGEETTKSLTSGLRSFGETIATGLEGIITFITEPLGSIVDAIANGITDFDGVAQEHMFSGVIKAFEKLIKRVGPSIGNLFGIVADKALGAMSDWWDKQDVWGVKGAFYLVLFGPAVAGIAFSLFGQWAAGKMLTSMIANLAAQGASATIAEAAVAGPGLKAGLSAGVTKLGGLFTTYLPTFTAFGSSAGGAIMSTLGPALAVAGPVLALIAAAAAGVYVGYKFLGGKENLDYALMEGSDAVMEMAIDADNALKDLDKTLSKAADSATKFQKGMTLGKKEQNKMIADTNKLISIQNVRISAMMNIKTGRGGKLLFKNQQQELEFNKRMEAELKKRGLLTTKELEQARKKQAALIGTKKNIEGETKAIEKRNEATEKGKGVAERIKSKFGAKSLGEVEDILAFTKKFKVRDADIARQRMNAISQAITGEGAGEGWGITDSLNEITTSLDDVDFAKIFDFAGAMDTAATIPKSINKLRTHMKKVPRDPKKWKNLGKAIGQIPVQLILGIREGFVGDVKGTSMESIAATLMHQLKPMEKLSVALMPVTSAVKAMSSLMSTVKKVPSQRKMKAGWNRFGEAIVEAGVRVNEITMDGGWGAELFKPTNITSLEAIAKAVGGGGALYSLAVGLSKIGKFIKKTKFNTKKMVILFQRTGEMFKSVAGIVSDVAPANFVEDLWKAHAVFSSGGGILDGPLPSIMKRMGEMNNVVRNMGAPPDPSTIRDTINFVQDASKQIIDYESENPGALADASAAIGAFYGGIIATVPGQDTMKNFQSSISTLREYQTDAINFYKALEGGGQYLSGKMVKGGGGAVNINLGVNLEIDGFKLAEVLDETFKLEGVKYSKGAYMYNAAKDRKQLKPGKGVK
tara:strand:+ start:278 stop:4474 length:4197 start_codon:yes stop_codon:yes gene_type:complete